MKMRGYSVLFVCALCVFVMCGAAAVVAQDVTPEKKAAGEAKDKAREAKERGTDALDTYELAGGSVNSVADDLTRAIQRIGASNATVDTLLLPEGAPSKEDIKKDIGKLETAAKEAKTAVERLETAGTDSLSNQERKDQLTSKMTEVENKTTEAEQAAAAVTDEIPTIDAVITKADELQKAAEEASGLWNGAKEKLEEQLASATAAVVAINATKNNIQSATEKFATDAPGKATDLNKGLTDVVTDTLTPSLDAISNKKNVLQGVKDAAEGAKNEYAALAAKAKELKEKAEERRQKVQPEEKKDYSAGPLCSLALPALFFCWCVLFGM